MRTVGMDERGAWRMYGGNRNGWMMTSTSGLVDNLVRGGSTMAFQHEPEAVKSATYHADDEYDFKTNGSDEVAGEEGGDGDNENNIHMSALLLRKKNPGPDTDREDFAASPAAVDEDVDKCRPNHQEAEAANTGRSVPSRKRKQPSLEEGDHSPERAAGNRSNGKNNCSADGCTNQVVKGGVCFKHGAKRNLCSSDGCKNIVVRAGVCIKHGATVKRCSKEGCKNQAQKGGVCIKHGAKRKLCREEGCKNQAQKGGVCIKHGAKVKVKRCSAEGCTNHIVKGGVCIKHGAKVKRYSAEGCKNHIVKGGVCIKHGAKVKRCSHDDCTNGVVRGGVCFKHGAKRNLCSSEGCTNRAQRGGVCIKHGAKRKL
eukprot:scaffold12460_cov128-Skeletonema_marinoi.AAC.1